MQTLDTTLDLINNHVNPNGFPIGTIIYTEGYSTKGGVGPGRWSATGNVITASQDPLALNDIRCSDASGNEYELELPFSGLIDLNALGGTSAAYINIATNAGYKYSQGLSPVVAQNDIVNIDTIASLIARTGVSVGEAFMIGDRENGIFRAKTGLTANDWNIYQSSADLSIYFEKDREDNGIATKLKQRLDFDHTSDIFVLLVSDSTANEDTEWYRVMVGKMAALYPTWTFEYRLWNDVTTSWGAVQTVQTGTGGNRIRFYNGAVSGTTFDYFAGSRRALLYDGLEMDLIVTNYGLNNGNTRKEQAEKLAECLYTLKQDQPNADIKVTVQCPDYNAGFLTRSAERAEGQREVAELYGCQVIDAYNLFIDLVASTNGDTTNWYIDDIHPTIKGSDIWADLALDDLLHVSSAKSNAKLKSSTSLVPNGNFVSWINGSNAVPTFWEDGAGQTTLRNTTRKESGDNSARSSGVGTSGTGIFYLYESNALFERFKHWPQIVVAARVYSELGTSGQCGKLFAAHSVSTSYTEIVTTQGQEGWVDDNWRWVFLVIPKSFYDGNSDFRIGFYTGLDGELLSVDRVVVSQSLLPADSDMSTNFSFRAESSDTAFTVPANGVTTRTFTTTTPAQAGLKVKAIPFDAPVDLLFDAHCNATVGQITVRISNPTGVGISMPATTYVFIVEADD